MKDRRAFSPEFKCEAAALVVDRSYSIAQACEAMGVGKTAMQRWVHQLISERGGATPLLAKPLRQSSSAFRSCKRRSVRSNVRKTF